MLMCQVFSFCVVANSCVVEVSGLSFTGSSFSRVSLEMHTMLNSLRLWFSKTSGVVYATRLYKRVGSGAAAYKQHLVGQ